MTIRKILPKTEKSLKPTEIVSDFTNPYVLQAIQDLFDTLANQQKELDKTNPGMGAGVGLASNQIEYPYEPLSCSDPNPKIGFYPKDFIPPRIYIVSIRPERAKKESCEAVQASVYINASFEPLMDENISEYKRSLHEEACLSVTGIKGLSVRRYDKIRISAFDDKGKEFSFIAEGFTARVHQHEIDHGRGEDYLNQLQFSETELKIILEWITKNKLSVPLEVPTWIVPEKLQCVLQNPDFDALHTWSSHEVKKI
jgi:peptide deformylase